MVSTQKYYQMISTIEIKHDCETLKALESIRKHPILTLAFLPFYAMFAEEIENTIGEKGQKFIVQNDSPFDISQVRAKMKLFGNEKINRSKKVIVDVDSIQDEVFKKNLKYTYTQELNIHYNLGIFFNSDGKVICNTQFIYFMFQNNKYKSREYLPEELIEFGKTLGTAISSVSEGLKNFLPEYKVEVNNNIYEIFYDDFNTNKKGVSAFTKCELEKEIALLVLHVLSAVNFVKYILSKELSDQNTYLLKIKYVVMYYAIGSIKKILASKTIILSEPIKETLNRVILNSDELMNTDFRSCMMHYEFIKNDSYLIDEKYLDFTKPFYGLIETYFNGVTYIEFCRIINQKISEISDTLENVLDIRKTNLKRLL